MIDKLLDAGPGGFEGGLTTQKYVSLAKVSRATSFREIADLIKKRILLKNEGRGRSVSYDTVIYSTRAVVRIQQEQAADIHRLFFYPRRISMA